MIAIENYLEDERIGLTNANGFTRHVGFIV